MTEFTVIGNFKCIKAINTIVIEAGDSIITITVSENMAKDLIYICPRTSVKVKGIIMDNNELVAKSCHILAGER